MTEFVKATKISNWSCLDENDVDVPFLLFSTKPVSLLTCSVFQESISPVRRGTDSSKAIKTATARGVKNKIGLISKTTIRFIFEHFLAVVERPRCKIFPQISRRFLWKTKAHSLVRRHLNFLFFLFWFFIQSLRTQLQKKVAKFEHWTRWNYSHEVP